jgi:hypothetical protein
VIAQPVRADVPFEDLTDRVDLCRDLFDALGHRLDALVVQQQPLHQRRREPGLLGGGDVLAVGPDQRRLAVAQGLGHRLERDDLRGAV